MKKVLELVSKVSSASVDDMRAATSSNFATKLLLRPVLVSICVGLSLVTLCSSAQAERITISVKGMVCSFCAQGIKKTFGRKDGVQDVAVDLDTKVVTITTNEDTSLPDTAIREAIVDAGYEVLTIERATNKAEQENR
jgi:copper chaperone CopZ